MESRVEIPMELLERFGDILYEYALQLSMGSNLIGFPMKPDGYDKRKNNRKEEK